MGTEMVKNKVLSWLHYIVAVIVVFDVVYILNYSLDFSQDNTGYLMGAVVGKLILIALHVIAAKTVKNGRTKDRLFSLFLTFFVLSAFPIGTILGVLMLIFIFKWQAAVPLASVVIDKH